MKIEMKIEMKNENKSAGDVKKKCVCDSGFCGVIAVRYENSDGKKRNRKSNGSVGRQQGALRQLPRRAGRIQQGRWRDQVQEERLQGGECGSKVVSR